MNAKNLEVMTLTDNLANKKSNDNMKSFFSKYIKLIALILLSMFGVGQGVYAIEEVMYDGASAWPYADGETVTVGPVTVYIGDQNGAQGSQSYTGDMAGKFYAGKFNGWSGTRYVMITVPSGTTATVTAYVSARSTGRKINFLSTPAKPSDGYTVSTSKKVGTVSFSSDGSAEKIMYLCGSDSWFLLKLVVDYTTSGGGSTYSITYDCDGGSGCPENASGQTALPDPLPSAPTKDGYTFDGWFTDEDKTEAAVAGATLTANATLYAKWTAIPTYTVTATTETGDNSQGSASAVASSLAQGETTTITATPASGYAFDHWTVSGTDATLSSTTALTTTLTMGSANATVTAYFVASACTAITPTLSYSSTTLEVGDDSGTPTLTGNTGSGTVTYSSSNTSVATVNASTGVVTAVAAGSATITATIAAAGEYCAGTAEATIEVTAPEFTISLSPATNVTISATFTAVSTGGGSGDCGTTTTFDFNAGNASGLTIDNSQGSWSYSVTSSKYNNIPVHDSYFLGMAFPSTSTGTITVTTDASFTDIGTISFNSASTDNSNPKVAVYIVDELGNETSVQSAMKMSSGTTKTWRENNYSIDLSSSPKTGKVRFKFTTSSSRKYAGIDDIQITTLCPPCTNPNLEWQTIPEGGKVKGTMTCKAASSNSEGEITYSSSDPSVATVTDEGVIDFVGAGTAIITATVDANGDYCEKSITQEITVSCDANDLAFSPSSTTLKYGQTLDVSTLITGGNDGAITYTTSGGTLNGSTFTAPSKEGSYIITATQAANGTKCSATKELEIIVSCDANNLTMNISDTEITMAESADISVSSNNGSAIEFTVSPATGKLTDTAEGKKFTATAIGTYTITATQAAYGTICEATVSRTIEVTESPYAALTVDGVAGATKVSEDVYEVPSVQLENIGDTTPDAKEITVTIRNTGKNLDLEISSIIVNSATGGCDGGTCPTIAPNETTTFTLTFPAGLPAGTHTATVILNSNDSSSPKVLTFTFDVINAACIPSAAITGATLYTLGQEISLTATSDEADATYAWYKGSVAGEPLSTTATFTKDDCVAEDAGTYICRITKSDASCYQDVSVVVKIQGNYCDLITGTVTGTSAASVESIVDGSSATANSLQNGDVSGYYKMGGKPSYFKVTLGSGNFVAGDKVTVDFRVGDLNEVNGYPLFVFSDNGSSLVYKTTEALTTKTVTTVVFELTSGGFNTLNIYRPGSSSDGDNGHQNHQIKSIRVQRDCSLIAPEIELPTLEDQLLCQDDSPSEWDITPTNAANYSPNFELAYSWKNAGGTEVSTSATFTPTVEGVYTVTVSTVNATAGAINRVASTTVTYEQIAAPTNVAVSGNMNVLVGESATLTASATNALSYEWFTCNEDGTDAESVGTGATITPSTAAAGTTYYKVVATNACGSTTSAVYAFTVVSVKTISVAFQNKAGVAIDGPTVTYEGNEYSAGNITVPESGEIQLTANATSSTIFLYWKVDGAKVEGNPLLVESSTTNAIVAVYDPSVCEPAMTGNEFKNNYRQNQSNTGTSSNYLKMPNSGGWFLTKDFADALGSITFDVQMKSSGTGKDYKTLFEVQAFASYSDKDPLSTVYSYTFDYTNSADAEWKTITVSLPEGTYALKLVSTSKGSSTSSKADIYFTNFISCTGPFTPPISIAHTPATGTTGVEPTEEVTVSVPIADSYYNDGTGLEPLTCELLKSSIQVATNNAYIDEMLVGATCTEVDGNYVVTLPHTGYDMIYGATYQVIVNNIYNLDEEPAENAVSNFTIKEEPKPQIKVVDITNSGVGVKDDATISLGTYLTDEALTKSVTLRVTNIGTGDLIIDGTTLVDASAKYSVVVKRNGSTTADYPETFVVGSEDYLDITITADLDGADSGTKTSTVTIASNTYTDSEKEYAINVNILKGKFTLPYTYQSGLETTIMGEDELSHDYKSVNDIPSQFTIGGQKPIEGKNFFSSYDVFASEGNCMPAGNSALKVGKKIDGGKDNSLLISIDEPIGTITLRWCASGYRKLRVTSEDGSKVYYQSAKFLKGGVCYENQITVNNCKEDINATTRVRVEFIASVETMLTTLYYMNITKCNIEQKSSACDIVDFAAENTNSVRIYEDLIFLNANSEYCAEGGETTLTELISTVIEVSPNATVSPAVGQPLTITNGYVEYTVTAEDGQTQKTYQVYVNCAIDDPDGCYEQSIEYSVPMNKEDQILEIIEISTGDCTMPMSGDDASYTIHFLTKEDLPEEGYDIEGLRQVCVGTVNRYKLANAAPSNGATYQWMIKADETQGFEIIPDEGLTVREEYKTVADDKVSEDGTYLVYEGKELPLKAPDVIGSGAMISLGVKIDLEYENLCAFLNGSANFEVMATTSGPTSIKEITYDCVDENGYLEIEAVLPTVADPDQNGQVIEANSYGWTFIPEIPETQISMVGDKRNVVQINLGIGNTPNINAIVVGRNGCGNSAPSPEFEVNYGARKTTWTGAVNTDWNNRDNWTNQVPRACTDAYITGVGNGATNYPIITGDDAECDEIYFLEAAGVKGLDGLTYYRAYANMILEKETWYTLTAPFKNTYSGDYYFNGAPVSYMRLFDEVEPVTGAAADGTWTKTFVDNAVVLEPGQGFAYKESQVSYNYPYSPRKMTNTDANDFWLPRMTQDSVLVDRAIPYSTLTGAPIASRTQMLARNGEEPYRFALEDGSNKLQNGSYAVKSGYNLIGNPAMAHLDLGAFYTTNSGVIANEFHFWNGSTNGSVAILEGGDVMSTTPQTSGIVPPMQSFFVRATSNNNVTYNLDLHYVANDGNSNLRSTEVNENGVLYVSAVSEGVESNMAIRKSDKASNSFVEGEDIRKLFTQYSDTEASLIAGTEYVDIAQFGELPYEAPIYIESTKEEGEMTFAFIGAESFENMDVTFVNKQTGEEVNLKEESAYRFLFNASNKEGVLVVRFSQSENISTRDEQSMVDDEQEINISVVNNNTIRVTSSATDLIQEVSIYDLTGRLIAKVSDINKSVYDRLMNVGHRTYIVKVKTNSGTKSKQVAIQ